MSLLTSEEFFTLTHRLLQAHYRRSDEWVLQENGPPLNALIYEVALQEWKESLKDLCYDALYVQAVFNSFSSERAEQEWSVFQEAEEDILTQFKIMFYIMQIAYLHEIKLLGLKSLELWMSGVPAVYISGYLFALKVFTEMKNKGIFNFCA